MQICSRVWMTVMCDPYGVVGFLGNCVPGLRAPTESSSGATVCNL